MVEKLLLVDFENVQQIDLECLDEEFQITIFVGASQKSVSIELVKNLQRLGNRVDWQKWQLDPKAALTEEPGYARVVEILGKSGKKARPRKRKTLSAYIASIFQKKIDHRSIDRIIDMLLAGKRFRNQIIQSSIIFKEMPASGHCPAGISVYSAGLFF